MTAFLYKLLRTALFVIAITILMVVLTIAYGVGLIPTAIIHLLDTVRPAKRRIDPLEAMT